MMKRLSAALLLGAVWLGANTVQADMRACLKSAHDTFVGCKTGCSNAFLDDKANCRGVDPGCLAACIDVRETCQAAAEAPLDACIATNNCEAIVSNARPGCKTLCSCGGANQPACRFNACFVECLDPYEQLRFTCRDNCRNLFQLNGGPANLQQCSTDFRTCRDVTCKTPPAP